MFEYHVVMRDPGCDCCSYVTVKVFDTLEEAQNFVGDDKNYIIEKEDKEEYAMTAEEFFAWLDELDEENELR